MKIINQYCCKYSCKLCGPTSKDHPQKKRFTMPLSLAGYIIDELIGDGCCIDSKNIVTCI
jgi:hypothetical protein